jgi:hypothetical protein
MRKSKKTIKIRKNLKRTKKCLYTDEAKRMMKFTRRIRQLNKQALNNNKI